MPTIFRDKVVVGDTTFNDSALRPAGAQYWGIDVLDGWKTSPDMEVKLNKISDVDGGILGDFQSISARYVTVSGYVLAGSRAESDALEDVLANTFRRNADLILERHEPVPKFIRCRRAGPIEITSPMDNGWRFTVDLVCPDPFKYSVDLVGPFSSGAAGLSSGGRTYPRTYPLEYTTVVSGSENRVVLVNEGTANAVPMVTINGPLVKGGWRLSNDTTGEDLSMDVGLVLGDVLTIDFANELVYLNGFLIGPNIIGDFWRIAPGTNVIKLYADYDPSTIFTISTNSAWE
jgi:hypothetical protein